MEQIAVIITVLGIPFMNLNKKKRRYYEVPVK